MKPRRFPTTTRWWLGPLAALLVAFFRPALEAAISALEIKHPQRGDRVSFHREVRPVLQANCLPCHNQTQAKAGLVLETPETMLKGGDAGPALVSGKPSESLLFRSAARLEEDLVMPPPENKVNARALTPDELGLLQLWIEQGAEADAAEVLALAWQPIPANVLSSFAVALTADGQSAAVARANRVTVYDTKTGRLTGQLMDPALDGAAQRDWVQALAFSPDGEILAAAGYREVRLWQRRPVSVQTLFAISADSEWVTASIAPGGRQFAVVTADARLEVRRMEDGALMAGWPFASAGLVQLAWSVDGRWLAAGGTNGGVLLANMDSTAPPHRLDPNGEVTALAWFDQGWRLAVAVVGERSINTWRRVENGTDGAFTFEPDRSLEGGHATDITALVSADGTGGGLISADSSGVIRRWPAESSTAPREVRVNGAVTKLVPMGEVSGFAALLATGGMVPVTLGESLSVGDEFGGDPRLNARQTAEENEITLSRLELARAEQLAKEAEAAGKSGAETLAKARAKHEADTKALADREAELAKQREIETVATKERDEFVHELQRVEEAFQTAEKRLEEARAAAQFAAEMEAAALVAAQAAERLKAGLERVLATLPESSESGAVIKTREAVAAAAEEAATLRARSGEAAAGASRARDELAARAFAAGQRKAEFDRAQADLPPRKKQAEERIAAARKAIPGLQTQAEKARITLDGSARDVTLAENVAARAATSLAAAQTAAEAAHARIATAEERLKAIQEESVQSRGQPVAAAAGEANGASLLTVYPNGRASRWDVHTGNALATFSLTNGVPLALAGAGAGEFFAIVSGQALRVDARREWMLNRTIGGSDAPPASGPFVDRVNALAFSPDGELLATGGGEPSRSGELKLWRVSDGGLIRDWGALHSDCVMAVAFSPRGERLATGGADRFARITPVTGDGPRINLEGHTHHVLDVAWGADGSVLATAGAEGMVKLWDPESGERRKNVEGFGKEVTGVRQAGLTQQFIAVSGSGAGRIFKADGEKVRDLAAAGVFLQCLAVSRDGRVAAGAGEDGVLRLWNLADGEQFLTLAP